MAAIAQLKAVLGMDPKSFKAGIRDSQNATQRFQSQLASMGRTLGAAFSVGAIIAATRSLVDFASEIRHTADNLNIGTGRLQALNAVALKYGMSVADQVKMLGRLRQAQGKVADGDAEYVDALKALNIETEAFVNAGTDEALEMVAKAYAANSENAQAYSGVLDLLGRAGKKATAFMEELADKGLKRVTDEARKAGDVIRDELITELEALGTKQEQIMLRLKVGMAKMGGRIGTGAAQGGAMAGSFYEQFKAAGGGSLNPLKNLKAFVDVFKNGGIDRAAREASEQTTVTPRKTRPTRRTPTGGPSGGGDKGAAEGVAPAEWMDGSGAGFGKLIDRVSGIRSTAGNQLAVLQERMGSVDASGQGISPDSLASVGGFIGPQRPGLGIADRQLRIQQETLTIQREAQRIRQDMKDELIRIAENTGIGNL